MSSKEYYQKNKAIINKKACEYYKKNRQKLLEKSKENYYKNQEEKTIKPKNIITKIEKYEMNIIIFIITM